MSSDPQTELGTGIQPKKVGTPLQALASTITHGQLRDDEIEDLVTKHWPKVVVIIVAAIAGLWVWDAIQANRAKVQSEISSRFTSVQENFKALYLQEGDAATAAPNAQQEKAFEETLRAIKEGYSSPIYQNLATAYEASRDLLKKNPAAAIENSKALGADRMFNSRTGFRTAEKLSTEDFAAELGGLITVRALYALKDPSYRAKAELLVRNSVFVGPEAMVFLGRTAETEADKETVRNLAKDYLTTRPEFQAIVSSGMSELGIVVKEGK